LNPIRPLKLPRKSAINQTKEKEYWNSTRSKDNADFYTIGYSGRSIIEFVNILTSVNICSVVDIRFSAISLYKKEYNKSNLEILLKENGISYFHRPELGISRDIRSLALNTNDRSVLWNWYDRYVVSKYVNGNLDNFLNSAIHPIVLLCVEFSPLECHRHRLALALETKGLKSYDL
jgi:uncharacterized protein (DUF488 family)